MPASDRRRRRLLARRHLAAVAVALVAVALAAGGGGATASAQSVGTEAIDSYAVAIDVRPTGAVHVQEVIAYQFGFVPKHGIFRRIPVRVHYDGRNDRVWRVHDVRVTAAEGTPANLKVSDEGNDKVIRIGDPNRTITGSHTYTIDYDVDGALSRFPDHDELYWSAIGTEWSVPIARPAVTVAAPAAITAAGCFAGPFRSSAPCGVPGRPGGTTAAFSNGDLGPSEGLTVVVGLPPGTVAATGPILEERWSPVRAFAVTPATAGIAVALLALGLGGIAALFWRHGRDRRLARGTLVPPGAPMPEPGPGAPDQIVPLFTDRSGPVLFRPPDGLRPAQLGVLVDERADPVDVTATIVDLAVRGYLSIEELERPHRWSKADWNLVEKKPADEKLLSYERKLHTSLFGGRTSVQLSELRNTFSSDLHAIQDQLYDDSVAHGWFAKRPDRVRSLWLVLGIALAVAGAAATAGLAATTHLGLIPIPIVITGLVLAALHRWMPARTAKGSAALAQALGFRRYIETAETERMRFAEEENIWATYLPYAVVFGATRKWARAFAGLGADQQAVVGGWYVSPYPFEAYAFSDSMESFAHATSGTIVSTPSGSGSGFSGGFSGGGGGGGGGGSW